MYSSEELDRSEYCDVFLTITSLSVPSGSSTLSALSVLTSDFFLSFPCLMPIGFFSILEDWGFGIFFLEL